MSTLPAPKLESSIVLNRARKQITGDVGITPAGKAALLSGVVVYAERGYYKDSMGEKGVNDAGLWDDAAWLVNLKTNAVTPFRWNTDPSRFGWNEALDKPFAILQPGVWPFHKGQHKGKGAAWRQMTADEAEKRKLATVFSDHRKDGSFRIWRGTIGAKMEIGYFAINIHWGGEYGTSSWGCQTAPSKVWPKFQTESYAATVKQPILAYILADAP